MGFIIIFLIELASFFIFYKPSEGGHLTFFSIWSMITLTIFLINAFNLPQSGEKPFTRPDTLDYMKSFTGDHSIHNTFSLNLQYLILALLNILITIMIYKTQF